MGDGLVDLTAAGEDVSKRVVGLDVVGIQFQTLAVIRNGLVDLSAASEEVSEGLIRPRPRSATAKSAVTGAAGG